MAAPDTGPTAGPVLCYSPMTLCRLFEMFGQTHSEANLRQLGVETEFQLQHSGKGTTLTSECINLAPFLPVPFGLKG